MALTADPFDIVVPTLGRASLGTLLAALAAEGDLGATRIVVVDDRPANGAARPIDVPAPLAARTRVVAAGGRGPAAARNAGWRATAAPWVVFLDDDVVPTPGWSEALRLDLATAAPTTAAVQGEIVVPSPAGRPPTDRERNVGRLQTAAWITADLAVRRAVLEEVDGFDERFPRAYREDTDFQLRVAAAGHGFARGRRITRHPVGPAPWWSSIAAQRGNADDALLRARHGAAALDRGRRPRHQLVTAALVATLLSAAAGRHGAARVALAAWAIGTAELTIARIAPGPKTPREIATMVATSVVLPPMATYHWWRGRWRSRHVPAFR